MTAIGRQRKCLVNPHRILRQRETDIGINPGIASAAGLASVQPRRERQRVFLSLGHQRRLALGGAELGGIAAFYLVDRVRFRVEPVDRIRVHHRQVVILVEHLDEGLPVAVDLHLAHPRGGPLLQLPGLVIAIELRQPVFEGRRPGFKADEGETRLCLQRKLDQPILRGIEFERVFHARIYLQAPVQVVSPPVKRAFYFLAVTVAVEDPAAAVTAAVGKGFQRSRLVTHHDQRHCADFKRRVIACIRPAVFAAEPDPALLENRAPLQRQQTVVGVAGGRYARGSIKIGQHLAELPRERLPGS